MNAAAAAAAAERLLGRGPMIGQDMARGGNNRLFLLRDIAGRQYVAKCYAGPRADGVSRLETEFTALRELAAAGFSRVPMALVADADLGLAVYEHIEGLALGEKTPTAGELEELLRFLEELAAYSARGGSACLGPASEACDSPGAALDNIEARLNALGGVRSRDEADRDMRTFLERNWEPAYRFFKHKTLAAFGTGRLRNRVKLTMSPGDFGTHNALALPGGGLAFVDFEYFGWDDPAKMIADFCWHPAMRLGERERRAAASRLSTLYGDRDLPERLGLLSPLYGLRWCLIMLNPFLRRDGRDTDEAASARRIRLAGTAALLGDVLASQKNAERSDNA